MIRALIACFLGTWLLMGCNTQRKICPAYQSAFVHDRSVRNESFVYYNANKSQAREVLASNSKTLTLPANDSTWANSVVLPGPALPIEKRNKRTRYLLLPEKTYKKALRALQTVEMKPVYPPKQTDSTAIKKLLDSAARSITDTLSASSKGDEESGDQGPYVISTEKEKFNVEQDNYMWYFRKILVLPDVKIAMEGAAEQEKSTADKQKKGFFGGLFKKKPKETIKPPVQPSDSTSATTDKQKKGLSGLFKKKSKTAPTETQKKVDAVKKEEEEKF